MVGEILYFLHRHVRLLAPWSLLAGVLGAIVTITLWHG